jgi:hypothetical protein
MDLRLKGETMRGQRVEDIAIDQKCTDISDISGTTVSATVASSISNNGNIDDGIINIIEADTAASTVSDNYDKNELDFERKGGQLKGAPTK